LWIVDSSVWIDFFNGKSTPQTDVLVHGFGWQEIGLGDINLCEVLQGFHAQSDFERAREALLRFSIFPIGGHDIAIKAAENYRSLRRQGITVRKTVDCLLATFVIENGHSLLHSDRDFDHFVEHFGMPVIRAS
jgi:predicted nucleic acid-binding protein